MFTFTLCFLATGTFTILHRLTAASFRFLSFFHVAPVGNDPTYQVLQTCANPSQLKCHI